MPHTDLSYQELSEAVAEQISSGGYPETIVSAPKENGKPKRERQKKPRKERSEEKEEEPVAQAQPEPVVEVQPEPTPVEPEPVKEAQPEPEDNEPAHDVNPDQIANNVVEYGEEHDPTQEQNQEQPAAA